MVDMRLLSSDGAGQVLGQGQAPRASPSSVQQPPHSAASEPSVAATPFGSRPAHLQYRSPSRISRTMYMASEYDYSGTDIDALRMQSVAASSDGDSIIDPDTEGFGNRQSVAGEGRMGRATRATAAAAAVPLRPPRAAGAGSCSASAAARWAPCGT